MKQLKSTLTLAGLLIVSLPSQAIDFDFIGTFTKDNDVVGLSFTVGAPSTVTVFSSSWVSGGFDPILAIWDSSGNQMAQQDDGHNVGSTPSNGIFYNHGTWDSYYQVNLAAGTYLATIAQYNNFSVNTILSNGFIHDGAAGENFTFVNGYGGATQPLFNGVWDSNDPRTGNWEFHILNVASASQIPPPGVPDGGSTAGFLILAMTAFGLLRRK